MQCAITIQNQLGIDHGKFQVSVQDDEGVVPVSGLYSAFFGIVDPLGAVISDINILWDTFIASGATTGSFDISRSGNNFIPGEYIFTFTVRDGVSLVFTKNYVLEYAPGVFVDASLVAKNNDIQVSEAIVSCTDRTITLKDNTSDAGWLFDEPTVFTVTAPATALTPNPLPTNYAPDALAPAPTDGEYSISHTILRSKSSVVDTSGGVSLSLTILEALVNVFKVQVDCAKFCSAYDAFLAQTNCINTDACAVGGWGKLSNSALGLHLERVTNVVSVLLADKCGDNAKISAAWLKVDNSQDCGCGC